MAIISTRDLSFLPDIEGLRRLLQSLALLDAVLCGDWEGRYYSFDAQWANGQMLGSMRNGSGDAFQAVFTPAGCLLKGFVHEAPLTPHRVAPPAVAPGVLDHVPAEFSSLLTEPSLDMENTTFCIWRKNGDDRWHSGPVKFPDDPDPDGSEELLRMLDGKPETYVAWATEYYGEDWEDEDRQLDVTNVARVYRHEPLTKDLVAALNPTRRLDDVSKEATAIGYHLR